jgi:hypothetical protein
MGYKTYLDGSVQIDPPIPSELVRASRFHPNGDLYGTQLAFVLDGAGNAVRIAARRYDEENADADRVVDELREIIGAYPHHRLTGHLLGVGEDPGDMWRVDLVDGEPYAHNAEICWPDAPTGPEGGRLLERIINQLYDANRHRTATSLDDALLQAGLVWRCGECDCLTPRHITWCDGCGKERPEPAQS